MADILSDEKQAQMMAEYDKWIRVAKAGRPAPLSQAEYDAMGNDREKRLALGRQRAEEIARYDATPGAKIFAGAKAATVAMGYPVDPNTGEFTGINAGAAKFEFQNQLDERRKLFEKGLNEGVTDQSHFNKAMDALFSFNILTFVKELFMSIPIVGDAMAAGGKMMMSLFSGKPIGPMEAYETIKLERAMGGGLSNIGIKDKPSVDGITSRVVAGGFQEAPTKVFGKLYAHNSPLIADEVAKIKLLHNGIVALGDDSTRIIVMNGADGKPLTLVGNLTGNSFKVNAVLKTREDGSFAVMEDVLTSDNKPLAGQELTIVNGALGNQGAEAVRQAAAKAPPLISFGKAYDTAKAPEVAARVNKLKEQKIDGIDALMAKPNASVMVLKDGEGKDIVVLGTKDGDKFTVDAVVKVSATDGKFVKADVKKADGTSLVGQPLTLVSGAMSADDSKMLVEGVTKITTTEPRPMVEGKAYSIGSIDIEAIRQRLRDEKIDMLEEANQPGKSVMVIKDGTGKEVIVVGRMDADGFTVDSVAKEMNGKLTKIEADIVGKKLAVDSSKGALTEGGAKALKDSVSKEYRPDGLVVVTMNPDLEKAAREYATLRFTDLDMGVVNTAKVEKFVSRYSEMVVNARAPDDLQKARAAEISERVDKIRKGFAFAAKEAKKAEDAPVPTAPADDRFAAMKKEIKLALDIMTGAEKKDDTLGTAFNEANALTNPLPPPTTPALSKSAILNKTATGMKP